MRPIHFALPAVLVASLSCSHATATPTPAPAAAQPARGVATATTTTTTTTTQGTGTATTTTTTGRGAPPPGGGPPGAAPGGRAPVTPEVRAARRDTMGMARAAVVKQLMATIAGRENEPAGTVFKNVQLNKEMPAGKFLVMMDSTVSRALSTSCTNCHVATDYSDDSRQGKKTARIMMSMVAAINSDHLSKLPARGGSTPAINCMTCHRGNGNPGNAIMP